MSLDNLFEADVEDITEIVFVLDCSTSMRSVHGATIEGFNAFLADQKRTAGHAYLTLVTFSSYQDERTVYDATDIQDVEDLDSYTYQLRGSTALLDAIGNQIINTNRRLAHLPEDRRPSKVIFAILTDGQENQSRDFTADEIKEMVTEHEDIYEWDFLFLGANQNAFTVGQNYGIKPGKALSFSQSGEGVREVFNAVSRSLTSYRESGAPAQDAFFTEEEHQTQRGLGAAATPTSAS